MNRGTRSKFVYFLFLFAWPVLAPWFGCANPPDKPRPAPPAPKPAPPSPRAATPAPQVAAPPSAPNLVRLSMRHWPEADRKTYEMLNQTYGTRQLPAEYGSAMIVGTTGPLAIHSGLEALKQGGSAADAALTTALAQIVLSGGSWNSFAGLFYMVYYDAATQRVYCLNAGYDTVRGETEPRTIPTTQPSGRTTLVPGFMAGVEAAHRRFGKLPFDKLFEPAIDLAEDGFTVDQVLHNLILQRKDVLTRLPETRAVFTKPDGRLYQKGDLFKQPALARTLRTVATQGGRYMYAGPWAEKMVAAVRREGGKLALEDLKKYQAQWTEPLRGVFRNYEICAINLPELGGVQTIEALTLAELANLREREHYTKSAETLHTFIQICRAGHLLSFLKPCADPRRPQDPFLPENRLKRAAIAQLWQRLQKPGWETELYQALTDAGGPPGGGTHSDGIVVVDAYGNVAAIVHSSNCVVWGSTGIFIDGVSLPDSASFQQDRIARAGPGARLPNITNPLLVLQDGQPVLASSCIGSALHEATLQNLVNVLEFEMDPKTSVETPNFWGPYWALGPGPQADYGNQVVGQGDFPAELLEEVRRRGQAIKELPPPEVSARVGYWLGIQINSHAHLLRGAVSPKLNGIAEGY